MIRYKIKSIANRAKTTHLHTRDSYWEVNKVISLLKKHKNRAKYFSTNGKRIKTSNPKHSLILSNYQKWGQKCQCDICGLEGRYFVLEKAPGNETDVYHFNLYTIDKNTKEEIYFNIDHIKPKSKGGSNHLSNYQLTCEKCNLEKGNKFNSIRHWWNKIGEKIKNLFNWS